jgi:CheY-like chemotaxis protein
MGWGETKMAGNHIIECPKCGHENEATTASCANCHIDLKWALEHWGQYVTGAETAHAPLILVSDDDIDTGEITTLILKRGDYRTAQALDGPTTLALAEQLRPDLIVTDIMKPGMSGIEMISHLRVHPALRDIPVIVLSAGTGFERVSAAVEAGAACYLCKPNHPRRLLQVVSAVLAGAQLPPLILLVHGEIKRVEAIDTALVRAGCREWFEHDGEAAMRWARFLKPDLIVVASHLSDMSGLDLLAQLKADPSVSDIPVVVLAEESEPELQQQAMELGAHGVYSGPLHAEELWEVIRRTLGIEGPDPAGQSGAK